MAMKIRLARGGSKKRPFYRIVAADSRMPRDGRFIEKLGTYNPLLPKDSEERVKMDVERVQYWLSKGAQTTDRVARMLEAAGVAAKTERSNPKKAEPARKPKSAPKKKPPKQQTQRPKNKIRGAFWHAGVFQRIPERPCRSHAVAARRAPLRSNPVDEAVLQECLDAFLMAPSVGLSEPWRIVRLRSRTARDAALKNYQTENRQALAGYDGEKAALYAGLKLSA